MQHDTPRVIVWPLVWPLIGAGALFAVLALHLSTATSAGGPVAVPDIPAYLGIAQWVGGDGLATEDIPFQPGYGLLIAPLVAVSQVPELPTQGEAVHYLALVVNSLSAVAAVVVAGRLGLVVSQRWRVAGAAGLIAAVHPSLSSASRIAWPETLLTLAVLVVALSVGFAVTAAGAAASQRAWARAGLLATLTVAVHARMAVLVVAVVLTAMLCRIARRAWIALGAGLVGGATATAAALTLTGTWPAERLSEAAQLDRGLEPIVTFAGQLLALGGGTIGLGVIGLVAGLGVAFELAFELFRRRSFGSENALTAPDPLATTTDGPLGRQPRPEPLPGGADSRRASQPQQEGTSSPDALTAALVCVAIGVLGALLAGGWTLTGSERADALLYGRYVDPWAVPLAVVALAWLATRHSSRRRTSAVLGTSAAVALTACALVVAASDGYEAIPRRIMTLSLSPAWTWLDERLGAVAVAALVSALIGVLLASATVRRQAASVPPVALGTLVGAVLALGLTATVSNHRHLADVGEVARGQVVAAEVVAQAVDGDGPRCLAHDRTSVPDYALWLYRLELPEIAHERVELNAGGHPCSELVIADDDLPERCANARHLVDEPAASWALWHLPEGRCIGV
ncbi:hypothetical protein [Candidatus Poriferisodalis sp.]|uniref:hypothetical protein n=1 Tax=Candidatus Poriferisodalis sp. TaxID=3101277 RepID=UPI003B0146A6